MINHGALFNGIGGFQIAASMMGWKNVFSSEIDEFCNRVTKYHFPGCKQYGDIKQTSFIKYANRIDILTGGFPCQPYSKAGKRKGKNDERHLWPEMLRAITEIQPRWVVGENVLGLINWNGGLVFHEIQTDLETAGYEVWPYVLPACSVNAPHERYRIWFVAKRIIENTNRNGWSCNKRKEESGIGGFGNTGTGNNEWLQTDNRKTGDVTNSECQGLQKSEQGGPFQGSNIAGTFTAAPGWKEFPTQSPILGRDDGVPRKMDGVTFSKWRNESIRAYGNAVVPAVVYQIFKAIELYDAQNNQ